MKRIVFIAVVAVLAVGALAASGVRDDPITGTWYGGSTSPDHAGFYYIYVFSPISQGRWQVLCFPVSNPANYGFNATMTPFAGEIVKKGSGYELRIMAVGSATANVPPSELPSIGAGRAVVTVVGPGEIKLLYDTAGGYAWGKAPFVDAAAGWAYRPGNGAPVPETLRRMNTTVDINLQ